MTAPPRLRARVAPDTRELRASAGEVIRLDDADALVPAVAGAGRRRPAVLEIDGRPIAGRSRARRVQAGLAVVSGTAVAPDLSVRDHLVAAGSAARADQLLGGSPLLEHRGDDPAGVLSGGERRVLAWLTAVAVEPRVVLLDRAGTGLDPDTLGWAHAIVDGWLDAGAVVLVRAGRPEEGRWVTHGADGGPRTGHAGS